ncbi:uncharacterized protein LOC123560567 [Mercenaria mercenaria]|uniref:uncharacterized protein LOC123560567 n=1 Tax=Mercenaria mercenaria TaxID=6596 RepID=UPI001E1DD1E2|nr:uncharacterized protein LOC123560567 [Mercenaria mercenaria]
MSGNEWERLNSVNIGVSVEESQEFYRTWADSYNKDCEKLGYTGPKKVAARMSELFSECERENIHILDVGAGTGLVAMELKKVGFKHIDALEPSESMLQEAMKAGLYKTYFKEFLNESPTTIPAGSYDVITGCGIYGDDAHVPCEASHEMIRLVKQGGYIVLATRNELVQNNETYKHLEPLMDNIETNGKWKKVSRDVFPRFNLKKDGIMWCYQVLQGKA